MILMKVQIKHFTLTLHFHSKNTFLTIMTWGFFIFQKIWNLTFLSFSQENTKTLMKVGHRTLIEVLTHQGETVVQPSKIIPVVFSFS